MRDEAWIFSCLSLIVPRRRGNLLVLQQKLTVLESERSIVGVNAKQDALVPDVFFGDEADARAYKGYPANGFLRHRLVAQLLSCGVALQAAGRGRGGTPTPQDKP